MRILILNWRDITHPWAGGAERHLHELAKQWIKSGHEVLFLCGGYKGALRSEKIGGIQIFRIGDTYLCYLFYFWMVERNNPPVIGLNIPTTFKFYFVKFITWC